MSETLQTKAISGLRWMSFNIIGERILSFGTTMVLARILDPAHFGLYALAFVVIDSLGIFKNLGLDAAIVQRKDRVEEAADTALFILPLIGLSLCGLLAVAAPFVAQAMRRPELTHIVQALGLALVLMSLGNVPAALIQRRMKFEIRTIGNLTGMAVYAAVAIVLALRGFGVWSLVIAYLSRWALSVPIQWMLLGWRPRWQFDRELLHEMLHFSKYIVGAWIVGFLAMNTDKIAIGRWLGATQLGYYTLCLGLANVMTTQLGERLYQVAFPAFAEAQGSPDLLRRGFLKLLKYLLMCALPFSLLLFLMPRDLLRIFYGERWVEAAPVLRVLALAGALQVLRSGIEPMLLGCGRSRAVFKLNSLQLVILLLGSYPAAKAMGLIGVSWVVVAGAAIPGLLSLSIMMRQAHVRPKDLLEMLRPVFVSVGIMAAVIVLGKISREQFFSQQPHSLRWLIVLIPMSVFAYGTAIIRWDRQLMDELLNMVRPLAFTPRGPSAVILYVESGSGYGGAATCLASLLGHLDRSQFKPIVAYYKRGLGIERIERLGVRTVALPWGMRWIKLVQLIQKEKVSIVHINNELYSHVPGIFAAWWCQRKCIVHMRGIRPLTRRERWLIPLVDHFIIISKMGCDHYAAEGISPDKTTLIYDGLDLSVFKLQENTAAMRQSLGIAPDETVIGMVSRLVPKKGQRDFLKAFSLLSKEHPKLRAVIVGGDPDKKQRYLLSLKQEASALGLDGQVIFTGWRGDVPALTSAFDVAVQASHYQEGFGTAIMEAMALGKPVIATAVGGIPELVGEEGVGLLVPPGDIQAMAQKFESLVSDAASRQRLGEAARVRIEELFDQKKQMQAMETLYNRILERRGG